MTSTIGGYDINAGSSMAALKDVTVTYGTITTTSVLFTLSTKYGSLLDKVKVQGLVAADFYDSVGGTASKLYNVTDAGAISVATLSESAGTYTITYTAQTSADVMKLVPVKDGYDFTAVHSDTFVIP